MTIDLVQMKFVHYTFALRPDTTCFVERLY